MANYITEDDIEVSLINILKSDFIASYPLNQQSSILLKQ